MENCATIDTTRHDTTRHDTTPIIRLFWTGGWDSTYRLVELSRMSVIVEPVYCIDKGRKRLEIERAAMKKILAAIHGKSETKAKILPIRQIDIDTLPENKDITQAYETVCRSVRLGSQYEWLAKVALDFPGIEMGIEKPNGEFSGCFEAIEAFGKLMQVNNTWKIDTESSSRELCLLFENISFPLIMTTEIEMLENVKKWHYEDLMSNIWFCASPINGKPCGVCRPCEQKMECKMSWLLPSEAHARYRRHKKLKAAMNIPVIGVALRSLRGIRNVLRKILR